jgi:hypothetical protein
MMRNETQNVKKKFPSLQLLQHFDTMEIKVVETHLFRRGYSLLILFNIAPIYIWSFVVIKL